jgi:hypothetical protein
VPPSAGRIRFDPGRRLSVEVAGSEAGPPSPVSRKHCPSPSKVFKVWFGHQPSTRAATLIFGFAHGFGLATKILDFEVSPEGWCPT